MGLLWAKTGRDALWFRAVGVSGRFGPSPSRNQKLQEAPYRGSAYPRSPFGPQGYIGRTGPSICRGRTVHQEAKTIDKIKDNRCFCVFAFSPPMAFR